MKTTKRSFKGLLTMLMTILLLFSHVTTAMAEVASDATASDLAVYEAIRNWNATTKSVEPPSTYDEVYNRIIACKDTIPHGTVWTDFMPYGTYTSLSPHDKDDPNIGYLGGAYEWNGGVFKISASDPGSKSGTGCAAFAFMMSDAAFGSMPARVVQSGNIKLENVHPGDILRDVSNSHFVIVLQTSDVGVVIAEANVKIDLMETRKIGKVNWNNRSIGKNEVEMSSFMITRYVEGQDYSGGIEETIVKEGDFDGVHWALTNKGVLTFSGSGAIPDFATWEDENEMGIWNLEEIARPWEDADVTTKVSSIIIENGITSIGACAFYKSPALSVIIPRTVTTIGIRAFSESKIISASISAETIHSEAFCNCKDLKTLTLGEGITTIGRKAFYGCTEATTGSFSTFIIPATVRTIGSGAFAFFNSIPRVAFAPNSQLTTIGTATFAGCQKMFVAELPEGLTKLEENLFQSNSSLYSVYVPKSVTEIDASAFTHTVILHDIYFGGTEEQWNSIGGNSAIAENPTNSMYDVEVHYNVSPEDFPSATNPPTPDDPHTHNWSTDWTHDNSYHWHNCTASDCDVSDNSLKDGYGMHTFGEWVIDAEATTSMEGTKHRTCTVCGYSQTDTIPIVTVPSWSNPDTSSSTGSPSNSDTNPKTNPDGSVTTTEKDKKTGTITETTKFKDGAVTIQITETNGTTTRVDMSTNGRVKAEVNLSRRAVENNSNTVNLLIPDISVTSSNDNASVVKINWSANKKKVNIMIPLAEANPATVAVIVKPDGSEEIIKESILIGGNLFVPLSGNVTIKIMDKSIAFLDVPSNHWATDAIAFVTSHNLFKGVGNNQFAPNTNMTRSMIVTVLHNLNNAPVLNKTIDFPDVSNSTWYTEALKWATTNKIINGYADGSFRPNDNVTREQIAIIMYRYANVIGVKATERGSLSQFKDNDNISSWAHDAMSWAIGAKLFGGDNTGNLNPTNNATRAEVATILMGFVKYIAK